MAFKKLQKLFSKDKKTSKPSDPELYARVKTEAKKKFKGNYPSAYASGWTVKTYKERGGKYDD
jgi:hypothetical protein